MKYNAYSLLNKNKSCPLERKKKITKLLQNIKVTFQVIYNFMKKLCLHFIIIHTNFHQNRSINKFAKMILA